MKRIILLATVLVSICIQQSFAQDSIDRVELSKLLTFYLGMKDALVDGSPSATAKNAEGFVKILNSIDYKVISENTIEILSKDASRISETRDIKNQRELFSNLSTNVSLLASAIKLSSQPVYEMYCPMKKVYWLSNEKTIKNPYYGNAMPTCGKIVKTIN